MSESKVVTSNPIALQENIIQGENYRFTLLTSRLIRMEYNEEGVFEDRATQTVMNRNFPKVDFRVKRTEDGIEIFTERMQVIYDEKRFTGNGLSAVGKGGLHPHGVVWHYGEKRGNLKGTTRTLDEVNGSCELEDGIMSLAGFAQIDDSHTLAITEDGWIAPRTGDAQDIYLFLYGCEYEDALNDFYFLTGKTPMLPRFALGNWWSRYYKYSEESYCALIRRFEQEQVPFTVAVIDMDWHYVEDVDPKYGSGWTGYTWNPKLFPDPERFLSWLHEQGMQTTLNLHPADGIRAFEKCYPAMAEAMGVDAEAEEPVNFDIASRKFLEAYFEHTLHPMEEEGVDFWWIDWQQGNNTKIPGLDPLWMLNHYHFIESARDGERPMTFSRYAGPGSHRYPVGFSGDTVITWESLDFQPYFTSTASNIGYGWWSHDIGGHMRGYKDNELALRWLQLGVFSPINRLHSTNNEFNGKEPWRYPMEIHSVMNDFLRLRHQMIPYLYTMNYLAWKENQPLVKPLYYKEPLNRITYQQKDEYYFGTQLLAAPITSPQIPKVNMGKVKVWLPEGTWIDFFTGVVYSGGRSIDMYRDLHSFPLLAKAGGIIPMTEEIFKREALENPKTMTLRVFAGDNGSFTIYEDDNKTTGYLDGICATTECKLDWENASFVIAPAYGSTELIPQTRIWTLKFCSFADTTVSVKAGGKEIQPATVSYDTEKHILTVELPEISTAEKIVVTLSEAMLAENDRNQRVYDFLNQAEMEFDMKTRINDTMNRNISIPAKLSDICSQGLSEDLVGCLVEILTA